jgi:hypothetical protein
METVETLKIKLQKAKELVISIQEQIKELQRVNAEKQKKLQAEKIEKINKAKLELNKICKYKEKYESGLYSIKKIAKITKKSSKTIAKIVKNEKWNGQANLQKKNQNIYKNQKQQVKLVKLATVKNPPIPKNPIQAFKEQVIIPKPKQINQFKSKIEHEPIEWSDEVEVESPIDDVQEPEWSFNDIVNRKQMETLERSHSPYKSTFCQVCNKETHGKKHKCIRAKK